MDIRLVAQPFTGNENLFDFIEHGTSDTFTNLRIVVAWAKRSGLGRVVKLLQGFRASGGHVQMIVGVSEGGATVEGLRLVMALADDPWVFHDPHRTFHPKVYLATGGGKASLLVGSNNLTAGGVGWNYETALWVDCDYPSGPDGLVRETNRWIDGLLAEGNCQTLDEDLIQRMVASPDIILLSEDRARRPVRQRGAEDHDGVVTGTVGGLFGMPKASMRPLPPQWIRGARRPAVSIPRKPNGSAARPFATMASLPAAVPHQAMAKRWYRELDHTQAQVPKGATSHTTGNVRLTQEDFPIDHKTYFLENFFAGLPWSVSPRKPVMQEVEVEFEVLAAGVNHGVQTLRVSHDPGRISSQFNVPTVLHWGVLAPLLRSSNYIGWYLTLERATTGEFYLTLSPRPSGPFVG